jgi:HK97 family phage major capsid protein
MTIHIPRAPNGRPIRVFGQLDPDAPSVVQVVNGLNQAFGDFRQRQDARFTELQQNQEELNRRIAAASVNPGYDDTPVRPGGRPRLSQDASQNFLGLLQGDPTMAMTVGSDPDGGFAVERELDREVLSVIRNSTAMRRLAFNGNLSMGFGSWKKLVTTKGGASGWAGESDTRGQTETATFGAIEVFPDELFVNAEVSNHLLDDSGFDVEQFLQTDVIDEFAATEGAAFANGNGSNRPLGLFQHPTSTDADATRAFGTLEYVPTGVSAAFSGSSASPGSSPYDLLIDLISKFKVGYLANASWLMSPQTAGTLRKIKDQDGRFIWQDSLIAGQPPMLLGYPVELDENAPAIGADSLSIAFGDFRRGYVIVDRPGMQLVRDPYTKKGFTRFYFTRRVSGRVLDSRAIKFIKFGTA